MNEGKIGDPRILFNARGILRHRERIFSYQMDIFLPNGISEANSPIQERRCDIPKTPDDDGSGVEAFLLKPRKNTVYYCQSVSAELPQPNRRAQPAIVSGSEGEESKSIFLYFSSTLSVAASAS